MLRDYEPNFFYLIQLCCGYVFSEIWLIVTLNILWHTWNKLRRNDSVFLFPLLCLCMMCLRKLWLGPVSFWWLSAIFRCGTRAERGWPISGHGSVDSSWSMIRADGKELEIDDPPWCGSCSGMTALDSKHLTIIQLILPSLVIWYGRQHPILHSHHWFLHIQCLLPTLERINNELLSISPRKHVEEEVHGL